MNFKGGVCYLATLEDKGADCNSTLHFLRVLLSIINPSGNRSDDDFTTEMCLRKHCSLHRLHFLVTSNHFWQCRWKRAKPYILLQWKWGYGWWLFINNLWYNAGSLVTWHQSVFSLLIDWLSNLLPVISFNARSSCGSYGNTFIRGWKQTHYTQPRHGFTPLSNGLNYRKKALEEGSFNGPCLSGRQVNKHRAAFKFENKKTKTFKVRKMHGKCIVIYSVSVSSIRLLLKVSCRVNGILKILCEHYFIHLRFCDQ